MRFLSILLLSIQGLLAIVGQAGLHDLMGCTSSGHGGDFCCADSCCTDVPMMSSPGANRHVHLCSGAGEVRSPCGPGSGVRACCWRAPGADVPGQAGGQCDAVRQGGVPESEPSRPRHDSKRCRLCDWWLKSHAVCGVWVQLPMEISLEDQLEVGQTGVAHTAAECERSRGPPKAAHVATSV